MPDEFQTIHRTSDPIEAEILADLLGQKGIDARVLGTRHGALIGVAQHILQLRIEVPRHQAASACELVDAYLAAGPEPEERQARREVRLRPVLAAGIVPVFPGGGHFYARRPAAAFVIILGYLGGLSVLLFENDREKMVAAMILLGGMATFDLIGAQLALRAFNRGLRASIKQQLALALSVLAVVAVASRMIAPYLPLLEADASQPEPTPPPPLPFFQGSTP